MKYLLWLALLALPVVVLAQTRKSGIEESSDRPEPVKADVSIGEQLFSDPLLSANLKVSCATCHDSKRAFSGGLVTGLDGNKIARRSPSVMNRANGKSFMADGKAKTLEEQALMPILNPNEMGNANMAEVLARVVKKYPMIRTSDDLAKALAGYERTLKSPENRLDAYLRGENTLSVSETRGWNIARGKGRCTECHSGPNLTDDSFANIGVGILRDLDGKFHAYDRGRFEVTGKKEDWGRFKVPSLRNVSKVGPPYGHDGSVPSLEAMIEIYNTGGRHNPQIDKRLKPLNLSNQEKIDLLSFLRSL